MRFGLTTAVLALAAAAPLAVAEAFWLPLDFGSNNPMVAVAVGDSITVGALGGGALVSRPYPATLQALLAPQYPLFTVLNRGFGGESTDGGLSRLPGVLATDRPGFVLIMEGTNDASHEVDPAPIVANLRGMIQLAKAHSSIPLIGAIPPNFRDSSTTRAIINDVNGTLRVVAAQEGIRFVDTFSALNDPGLFAGDQFHPNQQGYDVLAAAWRPALSDAIEASRALLGGVAVAGGHLTGPSIQSQIVVGFGPGQLPDVRTFYTDNTAFGPTLMPYPSDFRGGVRVAACDVDGDSVDDIVVGAGPGGGPLVLVTKVDASGAPVATLAAFFAFDPGFTGGVFVACGKLDGPLAPPVIVVGAGRGGGPHVRGFRYDATAPGGVVATDIGFFPYDPSFAGGVHVAVGNVEGDPGGREQIVVGAGPGGGPHVRGFRHVSGAPGGVEDTGLSFFPYDPGFTGGVFVAAGELDASGRAELITGAGPGGGPHVRIWRREAGGTLTDLAGFFAYAPEFRGGVLVGAAGGEVLTGAGPGGGAHVRGFTVEGTPTGTSFFAF